MRRCAENCSTAVISTIQGLSTEKSFGSPYPHAFIKKIDTEKAKALPGVVAVLTAKDVPGRNGFGAIIPDQPVLCGDKVRYIGDGVAMAAAISEDIAIQALELIEVEYELLPAVFSPIEAMKPDAPQIHEKGNLLTTSQDSKGGYREGIRRG